MPNPYEFQIPVVGSLIGGTSVSIGKLCVESSVRTIPYCA